MSDWPEGWIGGDELVRRQVEECIDLPAGEKTGATVKETQNAAVMIGSEPGEYLYMLGDKPVNHC